jgi:hypothetical protein
MLHACELFLFENDRAILSKSSLEWVDYLLLFLREKSNDGSGDVYLPFSGEINAQFVARLFDVHFPLYLLCISFDSRF